jgi:hypothetical protein
MLSAGTDIVNLEFATAAVLDKGSGKSTSMLTRSKCIM